MKIKKLPEKLNYDDTDLEICGASYRMGQNENLVNKINEIIDFLKAHKKKLECNKETCDGVEFVHTQHCSQCGAAIVCQK